MYCPFPSSPVEGVSLGGENRARFPGPRGGGHGEAKNSSSPEPELFLFLGGVRPADPEGQDDVWCEEDGRISGSWQFGFNGEMCLRFDSEDGHWTVDHSGGRRIKEKWEKDRAVTEFFKKVSMETVGPGFGSLWCTGRK